MDSHRYFTVAEANRLLPVLRELLETLQQSHADLQDLLEDTFGNQRPETSEAFNQFFVSHPHLQGNKERLETLLGGIRKQLDAIRNLGVELKDLEKGLLDFYSLRNGEIVFLCWHMGEETVRHWHTLEGGYSTRLELDEGVQQEGTLLN